MEKEEGIYEAIEELMKGEKYYENCINGNLMIDSKINYCNCDNSVE